MLLVPSPIISMFYNSTTLSELQAYVDSGVRLSFFKPEEGENVFMKPTGSSLDLSFFWLIIGSMFSVYWGFFTLRNKDYLLFLATFEKPLKMYIGVICSRVLLLILSFFTTMIFLTAQFFINGITLSYSDIKNISIFLVISILVFVFSLLLGTIIGKIKNKITGVVLTAIVWIVFVIIWPEIFNSLFSQKVATSIKSRYKHMIEKTDILMVFEREALKETGRFDSTQEKEESDKRMAEHYWNNERKKIEALESEMIKYIENYINEYHLLSILSPFTFCKSVNNELSSKGYINYIDFYKKNKNIQKGFLRLYFNKRFNENYSKVVPYLKKGANIVRVEGCLPKYFYHGIIMNIIYVLITAYISFLCFLGIIFVKPKNKEAFDKLEINFKTKLHSFLTIYDNEITGQILNLFFGKSRINGKILIDGIDIETGKYDRLYLPSPGKLQCGMKCNSFLRFLQSYGFTIKNDLRKEIKSKKLKDIETYLLIGIMLDLVLQREPQILVLNELISFNDIKYKEKLIEIGEKLNRLKEKSVLVSITSTDFIFPMPDYQWLLFFEDEKIKVEESEFDFKNMIEVTRTV